jgi:hypothetical protein
MDDQCSRYDKQSDWEPLASDFSHTERARKKQTLSEALVPLSGLVTTQVLPLLENGELEQHLHSELDIVNDVHLDTTISKVFHAVVR